MEEIKITRNNSIIERYKFLRDLVYMFHHRFRSSIEWISQIFDISPKEVEELISEKEKTRDKNEGK